MSVEDQEDQPTYAWRQRYLFPGGLLIFQCVFIILYGVHADYGLRARDSSGTALMSNNYDAAPVAGDAEFYYSFFQDVHVMMFIGFGFLMTFLRRYSFSAVCFNFLVAAFVLEWAILVRGYIFDWNYYTKTFNVEVKSLLHADFVCAAILISFGAVLGKTNPAQLVVMALIEVVLQVWNEWIGTVLFCSYDAGESIYVHIFGAYFGLAAAFALHREEVLHSTREGSSYASDIFSMIGTLFLFCFWPSFNAGAAFGDGRMRAIVNTYVSISASVVLTFITSAFVGKGKKDIIHIQNATLAGGVAVGAVADKNIGIFGAMIIGSIAGALSTLGYKYLHELLKKIHIHDTCGVHNLHGMPGVLSGLASIVVASMPWRSFYTEGLSDQCLGGGVSRTARGQAGFQCATIVITLGIAIVGGLLTGYFLRLPIFSTPDLESYFDDSLNWHVPDDFVKSEPTTIGTLLKQIMPSMINEQQRVSIQPPVTDNPNTIEVIVEGSSPPALTRIAQNMKSGAFPIGLPNLDQDVEPESPAALTKIARNMKSGALPIGLPNLDQDVEPESPPALTKIARNMKLAASPVGLPSLNQNMNLEVPRIESVRF